MASSRSSVGKKAVAKKRGRPPSADQSPGTLSVKDNILSAARIEFAERGFKLTTIRDIAKRGGVTAALIGYYFGSKQRLYDEVVELCTMHLNYPRLQMLDELEAAAGPEGPSLEEVLRVNVSTFRPILSDPHSDVAVYLRFFGRIYTEPANEVLDVIERKFSVIRKRFVIAIANAVPQVPKEDIYLRYTCMIGALLYVSANPKTVFSVSGRTPTTLDPDVFWDDFVAAWCRMLAAPPKKGAGSHWTSKPSQTSGRRRQQRA